LHKLRREQERRIIRTVRTAIRDGQNLSEAGTRMIHEVRKTGITEFAGRARVPRYMRRLEEAADALYRHGRPEDWETWARRRRQLRRYVRRLADGGKVKRQLLVILQETRDDAMPAIDRIMHFHAADKQRYAAERILRTDTAATFRAQQALSDDKHNWIIGYTWRMNRAARKAFRGRTGTRRLRGVRRRVRCICEYMDGKTVSKEWYQEHPGGGHPHCMCLFLPIFDESRLAVLDQSDL